MGIWNGLGLAQDRDRWRTLVSAVMNLRVALDFVVIETVFDPLFCDCLV